MGRAGMRTPARDRHLCVQQTKTLLLFSSGRMRKVGVCWVRLLAQRAGEAETMFVRPPDCRRGPSAVERRGRESQNVSDGTWPLALLRLTHAFVLPSKKSHHSGLITMEIWVCFQILFFFFVICCSM